MGVIVPTDGSAEYFAYKIRQLKGDLVWQDIGAIANYSTSRLSRAFNGRRLPRWDITEALVRAVGADTEEWRQFWVEMDACSKDQERWRRYRAEVVVRDHSAWVRPTPLKADLFHIPEEMRVEAVRALTGASTPEPRPTGEGFRSSTSFQDLINAPRPRRERADDPLRSEAFLVAVNGAGARRQKWPDSDRGGPHVRASRPA